MKKLNYSQKYLIISLIILLLLSISVLTIATSEIKKSTIGILKENNVNYIQKQTHTHLKESDFNNNNNNNNKFIKLFNEIKTGPEVLKMKVWNKEGTIIYSVDKELINKNFQDNDLFRKAINGETAIEIKKPNQRDNLFEKEYNSLIEMYIPIYFNNKIKGVIEVYYITDKLNERINHTRNILFTWIISLFFIAYIILGSIVHKASSEIIIKDQKLKRSESMLQKKVKLKTKELTKNIKRLEKAKVATLNILEDFSQTNQKYKITQKELNKLNKTLEFKIKKRTKDLETALNKISRDNFRLKELDKIKTQFIATASHELRTPLAHILGYLELLQLDPKRIKDKKTTLKNLRTIHNEATSLNKLVNNLLDISRMEKGTYFIEIKSTEIKELIKQIEKSYRILCKEKSIKFKTKIDLNVSKVDIDKEKIKETISNLINNAIKVSKKDSTITFTIKSNPKLNEIYVGITDQGPGIPKNKLKEIFKPFTKLHLSSEGAGLGLSIVKKVVEYHKGKVSVISQEGKGSTFSFTIPIKQNNKVNKDGKSKKQ